MTNNRSPVGRRESRHNSYLRHFILKPLPRQLLTVQRLLVGADEYRLPSMERSMSLDRLKRLQMHNFRTLRPQLLSTNLDLIGASTAEPLVNVWKLLAMLASALMEIHRQFVLDQPHQRWLIFRHSSAGCHLEDRDVEHFFGGGSVEPGHHLEEPFCQTWKRGIQNTGNGREHGTFAGD